MAERKEFGDGIIFTIGNYVWWFFAANIYFLLVNIPFIFISLVSAQTGASGISLLSIICSLPIGPALAALFSVMGKLIREKDIDVTKDFFKAYKTNFLEGLFFWTILVFILSAIYIDITVIKTSQIFNILFYVMALIIVSQAFYIFTFISRFYLRKIDVVKLAFIYSIKKIHVTILNWILLVLIAILVTIIPIILILFICSIYAYLAMYMQKGILKEIEEKFSNNKENTNNDMQRAGN
ncbi:YesL family protein [Candidatus Clostridium radicumherbarum]|uniref:YesL family protein n=1 Tax=Candidatus Clostridium radicumherbarum TaxID=3381662 RepID=A0ABW8TM14_9CLOT